MAVQGKAAVGADEVTVVADTGYSNNERNHFAKRDSIRHRATCRDGPIERGPNTSAVTGFSYDRESDSWRYPAGATLSLFRTHTQKKKEYQPVISGCMKPQCTEAARRSSACVLKCARRRCDGRRYR